MKTEHWILLLLIALGLLWILKDHLSAGARLRSAQAQLNLAAGGVVPAPSVSVFGLVGPNAWGAQMP